MKRFHVHARVKNLEESIQFYNALFDTKPTVVKPDYAKWMLDDPRINYAISTGHSENGIEHLGLQVETEAELNEVFANMQNAKGTVREEGNALAAIQNPRKAGSPILRALTGRPSTPMALLRCMEKESTQDPPRRSWTNGPTTTAKMHSPKSLNLLH